MHPVEDDLDDDIGPCQRGSDDAGVAVVERAHRVEQVRDAPHAEIEGLVRLLGARVRVAGRDRDLASEQAFDHRARAGKLRRQRHQSDGTRVEEALEQLEIRVPPRRSGMDPEAQGRQERPFEVRAQDAGSVRLGRDLAEGGEELLFGGGDERRQEGGDAGLEDGVGRVADSPRRRR